MKKTLFLCFLLVSFLLVDADADEDGIYNYLYYDIYTNNIYRRTAGTLNEKKKLYYSIRSSRIRYSDLIREDGEKTIRIYYVNTEVRRTKNRIKHAIEMNWISIINFFECTNKNMITAALNDAKLLAEDAAKKATSPNRKKRYNKWFGEKNYSKRNSIASVYNQIAIALRTKKITFDCSCIDGANVPIGGGKVNGTMAYVYSQLPYYINICPHFKSQKILGLNSQAGTIVHEMTHFDKIIGPNKDANGTDSGTDDIGYGMVKAKGYAENNPNLAIINADNYQFFAEDFENYYTVEYETETKKTWKPTSRSGGQKDIGGRTTIKLKYVLYVDPNIGETIKVPLVNESYFEKLTERYVLDSRTCQYEIKNKIMKSSEKSFKKKWAVLYSESNKEFDENTTLDIGYPGLGFKSKDENFIIKVPWKKLNTTGYFMAGKQWSDVETEFEKKMRLQGEQFVSYINKISQLSNMGARHPKKCVDSMNVTMNYDSMSVVPPKNSYSYKINIYPLNQGDIAKIDKIIEHIEKLKGEDGVYIDNGIEYYRKYESNIINDDSKYEKHTNKKKNPEGILDALVDRDDEDEFSIDDLEMYIK